MTTKYIWFADLQDYFWADSFDCSHCGATVVFYHDNEDDPAILIYLDWYSPNIYAFCDGDCGELYEDYIIADLVVLMTKGISILRLHDDIEWTGEEFRKKEDR